MNVQGGLELEVCQLHAQRRRASGGRVRSGQIGVRHLANCRASDCESRQARASRPFELGALDCPASWALPRLACHA